MRGRQILPDGTVERTEDVFSGTLRAVGGGFSLRYRDEARAEDAEYLIADGTLTLARRGVCASTLHFRAGETDYTLYETPYGALGMNVTAKTLHLALGESGGTLAFAYTLTLEGEPMGSFDFLITVKEEDDQ